MVHFRSIRTPTKESLSRIQTFVLLYVAIKACTGALDSFNEAYSQHSNHIFAGHLFHPNALYCLTNGTLATGFLSLCTWHLKHIEKNIQQVHNKCLLQNYNRPHRTEQTAPHGWGHVSSVWGTYSSHCMETSECFILCCVRPFIRQSHCVPWEKQCFKHTHTAQCQRGERERVKLGAL